MTISIGDLEKAYAHEDCVYVEDTNGSKTVKSMSMGSRIWHWRDAGFHEKRLNKIAVEVAGILENSTRIPLGQVANHRVVLVVNLVRKEIKEYGVRELPGISKMLKELAAIRLGIDSMVFNKESNQGFQTFAEKNYLSQYLIEHGHTVKVDPKTSEVSLKMDGVYTSWKSLKDIIAKWPPNTNKMKQAWIYGDQGIQNKDMYDWKKLDSYKQINPTEWKCQYIFELCVCKNPDSVLRGNHSWIRLKTPEGYVYSVGLYAEVKPNVKNSSLFDLPNLLSTRPGYLMSPDVSEYWNFEIRKSSHVITEEQYNDMVKEIEKQKLNGVVFQQFNNNCLLWCKNIAKIANIDVDTAASTTAVLMPKHNYRQVNGALEMLPVIVQKICSTVTAFFWNSLQWLLGANRCASNLSEHQKSCAKIHYRTISDLFEFNKTIIHHPLNYFDKIELVN